MKKLAVSLTAISLLVLWASPLRGGQDEIRIWKEFVKMLRDDQLTMDRIRPLAPLSKESQIEVLNIFRRGAVWEEWEAEPEIVLYDNFVNFIIPLKGKFGKLTHYCFMFLAENDEWYYRHVEAIFIRLDKISSLPASDFPDLQESQKAWMREELYWSKMVWLFNDLSEKEGKESALRIFRDGAGYFVAARAWVPFVPPSRAFILYLCWEQANLRGNEVTLEKLEEDEAVVKMNPLYFQIYRHAGHLKKQISFKDYRMIFEEIWKERAQNAGWDLQIDMRGVQCIFRFKR